MRFRTQLLLGLGALVALVTAMATIGIVALRSSAREGELAREYAADLVAVERLRFLAERLVASDRGFLLSGDAGIRARFDEAKRDVEAALTDLDRRYPGSPRVAAFDRATRDYIDVASSMVEQRAEVGERDPIVSVFERSLLPRRRVLDNELAGMTADRQDAFERARRRSQAVVHSAELALLVSSMLAIGGGIVLAFVVSRRLTREFDEVQLAKAAASRAAAAREEVLAVVSHDLRTPLQAITMGTSLVAETTGEDATRHHVRIIDNAAQRMRHIIDEVLEAARLEAGRVELRSEPVGIRELLERSVELFQDGARGREVALTTDAPAGKVLGDRERTIEVLSNLISNALKFSRRGGHVVVRAAPAGELVRFAVADDGPGIAPEQLPHVFDRYWQGARGKRRDGLGLGLYICKRLVEAQRGAIGVESTLGSGTTFWFTMPAVPGGAEEG